MAEENTQAGNGTMRRRVRLGGDVPPTQTLTPKEGTDTNATDASNTEATNDTPEPNTGTPKTDDAVLAALRATLEAGSTSDAAAEKHGVSVATVRRYAKEWGVKLKRGRPQTQTSATVGDLVREVIDQDVADPLRALGRVLLIAREVGLTVEQLFAVVEAAKDAYNAK